MAETVLYCNERALDMYLGHSRGSIREAHYTARDIDFMRREIVEKIEQLLASTVDKTVDNTSTQK